MDHMGFQVPGMAPPIMNHPPQVFGGYDGIPQLPPEIAAQMFNDSAMLLEDANDPKRRRIARACDMCRKKKIKCDGKMPSCTHCINYKTECVFTQVEKKRAPPKGAKYIEGLENRLNRMEHLLRLSGLLDEDDDDLGALEKRLLERQEKSRQVSMPAASNPNSPSQSTSGPSAAADGGEMTPQSSLTSPKDDKRKSATPAPSTAPSTAPAPAANVEEIKQEDQEEVEALSELMCSLVTNNFGETRYIGSSSGFSIFSPKGVSWVNSKTGDDSFQRTISDISVDDHKWTNWKPEVFGDLFQRPIFRPLPPKPEALSLLQDFFDNFNCIFPLFHRPTFMHLVHLQYSSDPYQGSGWWASLNCALAIAHRLRVMSNLVPQDEDEKAWGHLKNAIGVFPELTMRNTDLLSVQALLGMALFLQGTPNPQPTLLLVSAAMRLAHSIGLHKRGTGFNLNPIEIEQRKRVFWIAYMLDKDLCLRAGRPPAQDDDDMNVELPDADPEDNIGNIPLADGKGKMNLFRAMCEFATIESEVYKRLYSVQATKQSDGELLHTIGELDHKLEEWKDRIPIDYRPEHDINASHTPLILQKQRPKPLSSREKRSLGLHDIPKDGQKYHIYEPLSQMWLGYARELLGNDLSTGGPSAAAKLASAEFHGAPIQVVRSHCPSRVGIQGVVVRDRKFVFEIITKKRGVKVVPKEGTIFRVEITINDGASDGESGQNKKFACEVLGDQMMLRAADRANKKFKAHFLSNI